MTTDYALVKVITNDHEEFVSEVMAMIRQGFVPHGNLIMNSVIKQSRLGGVEQLTMFVQPMVKQTNEQLLFLKASFKHIYDFFDGVIDSEQFIKNLAEDPEIKELFKESGSGQREQSEGKTIKLNNPISE